MKNSIRILSVGICLIGGMAFAELVLATQDRKIDIDYHWTART